MQCVGMGEQEHVSTRVDARKAGSGSLVALDHLASLTATLDQPGDLLARVAADAFKEAQHHRLVGAFQSGIAEATHGARDKFVPLVCRHREIHRHGSG